MYVSVVHYHVDSGQMSNAACGSDPPPTSHFPSPSPDILFSPFIPCFSPPLFLSTVFSVFPFLRS